MSDGAAPVGEVSADELTTIGELASVWCGAGEFSMGVITT